MPSDKSTPTSRPSIAEMAAQLQKALDTSLAENELLAQQIFDFEKRAETAERRAREAQEKLKILESLKTKEYQTVVTELFEGPSRRAVRLTLIVAVASIAIGLTQTILSSIYTSHANDAAISRFVESAQRESSPVIQGPHQQLIPHIPQKSPEATKPPLNDGTTIQKALFLTTGTEVEGVVGTGEKRFYLLEVPQSTPRIRVTLTYEANKVSPPQIDCRFSFSMPPRADDTPKGPKPRRATKLPPWSTACFLDQPGLWRIEVRGFSSYDPKFKLLAEVR